MGIFRRLVIGGFLSLLLFVGAVGIYLHSLEKAAARVIDSSYALSQRQTPPTLDDLWHQFGKRLEQTSTCTGDGCQFEVTLSNLILAKLRLAPFVSLRSVFWVRANIVEENRVEVFSLRRKRGVVAYVDLKYCETCVNFDVVPSTGVDAGSGSVSIGSRASVAEKRAAFGFNPTCFSKLHGCASLPEFLPTIWKVEPAGTFERNTRNAH